MAIVEVRLVKEDGHLDANGAHYTETYYVRSDSATESVASILTASFGGVSIPAMRAAHPDDASAKVTKVGSARPLGGPATTKWNVTVQYDDITSDTPEDNPLNDPVRISWGHRTYTEVLEEDIHGNPIDNSAGDMFDPPLEQASHGLTLRVVRNEASFSASEAHDFADTINSNSCTICGLSIPGRVGKVIEISGEKAERNGQAYWTVTYMLEFNRRTWDRRPIDIGMYYLDAGERKQFVDKDKRPMQKPQRLNGSGGEGNGAVFLTFECNEQRNFNTLGLNI